VQRAILHSGLLGNDGILGPQALVLKSKKIQVPNLALYPFDVNKQCITVGNFCVFMMSAARVVIIVPSTTMNSLQTHSLIVIAQNTAGFCLNNYMSIDGA
jgi:hypothetical protein